MLKIRFDSFAVVGLIGTEKIDIAWIRTRFPKAKISEGQVLDCWSCNISQLDNKDTEVGWSIIRNLGMNGWEPIGAVATGGAGNINTISYLFRRRL